LNKKWKFRQWHYNAVKAEYLMPSAGINHEKIVRALESLLSRHYEEELVLQVFLTGSTSDGDALFAVSRKGEARFEIGNCRNGIGYTAELEGVMKVPSDQ
jgi:hypothetical protein